MSSSPQKIHDSIEKLQSLGIQLAKALKEESLSTRIYTKKHESPYKGIASFDFFHKIAKQRRRPSMPAEKQKIRPAIENPRYLPYNKKFLVALLASYGSWNWPSFQDSKLNPLCCALNGWKCLPNDVLVCLSCCSRLTIHSASGPRAFDSSADDDESFWACLEESYLEQLHTKHQSKLCPWYIKPASSAIAYSISSTNTSYELQQLQQRIEQLNSVGISADFAEKCFQESDIDSTVVQTVAKWCNSEQISTQEHLIKLAVTGWTAKKADSLVVFSCDCCLRSFVDDQPQSVVDFHQTWCCYREFKEFKRLIDLLTYSKFDMLEALSSISSHSPSPAYAKTSL